MGTFKKLVGVGVVTGVVLYAYLRKFSAKMNQNSLPEPTKEATPQLV
ncbi:hypothetical protein [Dyadobacter psychrotolerans]|nr:hypothetical protein [Dyadobacter psychrotolerans]